MDSDYRRLTDFLAAQGVADVAHMQKTYLGHLVNVYRLITRGLSNAEIGRELFISETTVKTHVTRLLQKLDVRDRAQAIVLAYQSGLFDASDLA